MYEVPTYQTKLVRDSSTLKTPVEKLETPTDVWRLAREYTRETDREHMLCFWLSTDLRVIGMQEVARGGAHGLGVTPRDILRGAIVGGAVAIVLAHNHPSGNPKPSKEDLHMTKLVADACDVVGISLLDHIVVTERDGWRSCTAAMATPDHSSERD